MNVTEVISKISESKFFDIETTQYLMIVNIKRTHFYFVIDYESSLFSLYNYEHNLQIKKPDGSWVNLKGEPIITHWSVFDITEKMVGKFSQKYIEEFEEFVMIDLLFMSSEYKLEEAEWPKN